MWASFSGVARDTDQGVETCWQVSRKSHTSEFFFVGRTKESNTRAKFYSTEARICARPATDSDRDSQKGECWMKGAPSEVVHEGLFICSVAKEMSVDQKLVVFSDSTATISQHSKMGLGRMKHVEHRFLFVKDLVKREKLSLCKVLGTDNPADV